MNSSYSGATTTATDVARAIARQSPSRNSCSAGCAVCSSCSVALRAASPPAILPAIAAARRAIK